MKNILFLLIISFLCSYTADAQQRSSRVTIQLGTQKMPKIWALIIGIADYQHSAVEDLKYAKDDAYLIANFYQRPEGGAIADDQMHLLIDSRASRANIIGALQSISLKAGEEDIILIYFAGHGLEGMFLPYDYDLKNTVILHSEIVASIEKSRAKHKIVIADACASGSMNGAIATLGAQGRSIAQAEQAMKSYYNAFQNSHSGTVFLLATKSQESALEYNKLRQGVFSFFLIEGLLKGYANTDHDNIITVGEIFEYLRQRVKNYTNGLQTPTLHGTYDKSMPIGSIR